MCLYLKSYLKIKKHLKIKKIEKKHTEMTLCQVGVICDGALALGHVILERRWMTGAPGLWTHMPTPSLGKLALLICTRPGV